MTLRQWMTAKRLTRAEAAKALGVHVRALIGWISYGKIPEPKTQDQIAKRTRGRVKPEDWHRAAVKR